MGNLSPSGSSANMKVLRILLHVFHCMHVKTLGYPCHTHRTGSNTHSYFHARNLYLPKWHVIQICNMLMKRIVMCMINYGALGK